MVNGYSLDPHPRANFAKEEFAVVRIPRVKRDRVPAASVEIVADLETAIAQADPDNKFYPAKVVGPARSSEGTMLYYIIDLYSDL
ncbi:MAG: hypothetical protein HN828_04910 [Candidatus Thioglobus sp.]|jgi:hypothetical protein|uniref:hypothetical protein n=1 Tax=Candidatus Thioglobus sp. TaxID=2026721 RepID=UPI001D99A5DF|nr:hypothetical protein [Candidatus Thioglobus sp.]MBT3186294.1 hypothetical protein [Candidatus Thioglobus sp.]MBT3431373.1 hypothetical protein [Candidatus Thioglobus sp.]MBT3965767.1 hypothetical protein [Candidatus Thioglobus sp.]MBT4315675.1 hypothetical protein [Candidatus Thioglobus sp.]MBT4553453.1 hypothetical protein [Candidatus Thioglobus sp.]